MSTSPVNSLDFSDSSNASISSVHDIDPTEAKAEAVTRRRLESQDESSLKAMIEGSLLGDRKITSFSSVRVFSREGSPVRNGGVSEDDFIESGEVVLRSVRGSASFGKSVSDLVGKKGFLPGTFVKTRGADDLKGSPSSRLESVDDLTMSFLEGRDFGRGSPDFSSFPLVESREGTPVQDEKG